MRDLLSHKPIILVMLSPLILIRMKKEGDNMKLMRNLMSLHYMACKTQTETYLSSIKSTRVLSRSKHHKQLVLLPNEHVLLRKFIA